MKTDRRLTIDHATALYDKSHGIQSITAAIDCGEITAIIGPNGAGKTTLMKAIAGLMPVSEGEILLSGLSTASRMCKPQIGYTQDNLDFYEKMTVFEVLDFICQIKYCGKFREEIEPYLKSYELFEQRNSYINALSMGMKRKLSIIMALIGTPQLILMDEPTNGIDTYGILQLKNDLSRCVQEGSAVIVTSHVLDFLEKICARCIFLKDGVIARDIRITDSNFNLDNIYQEIYMVSPNRPGGIGS